MFARVYEMSRRIEAALPQKRKAPDSNDGKGQVGCDIAEIGDAKKGTPISEEMIRERLRDTRQRAADCGDSYGEKYQ